MMVPLLLEGWWLPLPQFTEDLVQAYPLQEERVRLLRSQCVSKIIGRYCYSLNIMGLFIFSSVQQSICLSFLLSSPLLLFISSRKLYFIKLYL